jgi:threonine efflux protein
MEHLGILAGIALIHLLAISSPGPTLFVVMGYANAGDRRASLMVVLGVVAATLTWSATAAAGLGTLLAAKPWLALAIQFAGGAYLAWLGLKMLRSAWRGAGPDLSGAETRRVPPLEALRAGYITNISNPKVVAYYASLFGVMIPVGAPAPLFAGAVATAVIVSVVWWLAVALFFGLPPIRLLFEKGRRVIDALTGGALVLFGIRLMVWR